LHIEQEISIHEGHEVTQRKKFKNLVFLRVPSWMIV
jgi:hypothetical protein